MEKNALVMASVFLENVIALKDSRVHYAPLVFATQSTVTETGDV
jgi:hypothetical protein